MLRSCRECSVFNLPGGETFGITSSAEKNLKWEAYHFPVVCLPLSTGRKRPPGRWVPEVPEHRETAQEGYKWVF